MTKHSFGFFPLLILLMASPATAHTGLGSAAGFLAGAGHPLSGLDHILALVAIGVWASILGGWALWLVPTSFVVAMAIGGVLGVAGVQMPFGEVLIAASTIGLCALIAFRVRLPTAACMTIAGLFALSHGHAHGAEMPVTAGGFTYGLGFVAATIGLHLIGIGSGMAVPRFITPRLRRWAGTVGATELAAAFPPVAARLDR